VVIREASKLVRYLFKPAFEVNCGIALCTLPFIGILSLLGLWPTWYPVAVVGSCVAVIFLIRFEQELAKWDPCSTWGRWKLPALLLPCTFLLGIAFIGGEVLMNSLGIPFASREGPSRLFVLAMAASPMTWMFISEWLKEERQKVKENGRPHSTL
jgi:hypothetical protein